MHVYVQCTCICDINQPYAAFYHFWYKHSVEQADCSDVFRFWLDFPFQSYEEVCVLYLYRVQWESANYFRSCCKLYFYGIRLVYACMVTSTCNIDYCSSGESLLLNPDPSYSSSRTSPVVDACSIKALLMDLDGPMFNYQPLFAEDTLAAVSL